MTPMARALRAGGWPSAGLAVGRLHQEVHEFGQAAHAVDVVAVVEDHLVAVDLDLVEAPRRLEERGAERAQALADVVQVGAGGPRGRGRGQRVGHVHARAAAEGRGDEVRVLQVHCPVAVAQHHQLPIGGLLEHHRRPAAAAVAVNAVVALLALVLLHREVDDAAAALARHARDEVVVGIEHGRARARHGLDQDRFDVGQLRQRVDALEPQVVTGHVGHHGHVVAVVAQALAQDAAAGDLEHGSVDRRVLEHHLRRARPGHVALADQPAVDDDAVGRGHAHPPAGQLQDVGDHAHGRRLAVGAGDGEDRDARVRAVGEEQVDDRLGDVLRLARCGVGVHPEARSRVDLDDRPALLAYRDADIGHDEVDARDVQADDPGGSLGNLDVVRVGLGSAVDGRAAGRHVARGSEQHALAAGRLVVE